MIHKYLSTFTTLLSICLSLPSCSSRTSGQNDMADFDKVVYSPSEASGFSISGKEGSDATLLSVSDPWQGADSVVSLLFVARDGNEPPLSFQGQILDGDARRIVVTSSTHVAMLDALGATDRIVGVSGMDFITNQKVRNRRDEIADIGYGGNTDYEALIAANPDVVFLYGVNGANPMEGKLRQLGIPFVYIGDYLEESPLGKTEWIVAIAELIGEREKGETRFKEIANRYNHLKKSTVQRTHYQPKVMLNVPYGDSWFMPSADSYMARIIADAGGKYVYTKKTGNTSRPIDLEEAYELASEADFWLNVDQMTSLSSLGKKCPKFKDTEVFRNGNVFNNTRRTNAAGGNDFFESAIVNPDILLRDIVEILHPDIIDVPLFYYRKLE